MNKYFIFLSSLFAINSFSQTFNADVFEINYQTGLNAENLFDYQDKILFTGANVYGKHNVIWAYDKTTKKSYPVKEIETGWSSLTVSQFTLLKGKAYFTAVISNNELWVTDATSGGTYKVFEFPTNTYAQKIESFGDNLLAITTGQGLYISDGTAEGTKKVQEITGEIAPGISYRNGYVIFGAKSANSSNQMWASNGVDTFKILDVDTNLPVYIFHDAFGYTVGDKFIFYGVSGDGLKDGLWEFDNASRKAKYIAQSKSLSGGIVLNGKLIYQAWDSQFGGRVWVSDGTSQNTFPLNNQSQFVAAMTNQNFMFRNGNYIYFFPRNQNWNRLWKTDGTVAGTVATNVVIDDTMPDLEKSFPLNNKILIRSSDYSKHWILDANENVTPVNNKFDSSVEEPGRLIFPYSSAKYGNELFQYNFDNNAISIFHDGNHSAGSDPQNFEKTSSGQLIFTATNIESGTEFYGLPNKNSVPSIIKDFDYNGDFSYGIPKGKLFKVGNYYYQKPDNYTKVLARTDGSAANTNMLMFTGNDELDDDTSFANLNDNSLIILTYASDTDVRYLKLWKVDNSSSSINLVTQIPTGSTVHDGKDGVFYNGYIYFTILTPDNRTEIWQTDGTSVNTKKVSFNIADAEYYSNIPQLLAVFDNKLLIAKNYKLYAFDSSTDTIKEVSFPEDNGPFTPQINISSAPKIIDNKLYLLSQTGYGTVYRFNNMQEPPTPILSDNGMSYFSDFQKCGHSVYFATGPMKNRYNAFWSINPDLNSYEAIYLNNYSSTDRIADLTCVNNYMYYTKENSKEIFRTNGSKQSIVSSTITLDNAEPMNSTAAIEKIFTFAGDLYFRATTAQSGSELFHIKNELPTFLSVENLDGKSKITVSVSPNPTSGRINIHSLSKITKVEIYDFSGGKLFDAKSDSVDFSHLNSGVYLVKIYTDEFVETKKVIKK